MMAPRPKSSMRGATLVMSPGTREPSVPMRAAADEPGDCLVWVALEVEPLELDPEVWSAAWAANASARRLTAKRVGTTKLFITI